MDIKKLQEWIGRSTELQDEVTAIPIRALSATLDREDQSPVSGDALPPLWQWLYFLPIHRQSELGSDGHPARGGFLPPVPLPRRMWAGSRIQFHQPLRVGEAVTKRSRILDVSAKEGRSGSLAFVTVEHQYHGGGGLAIREEQDIVYRADVASPSARTPEPAMAPCDEDWAKEIMVDPVMMFRFSALTFNGHRIHYDRNYATAVEGYPELVVHGPLLAVTLMELVRKNLPDVPVKSFAFKGVRPTFSGQPFHVCGRKAADGRSVALWIRQADGSIAMSATAELG